jgi:hypothetical protein
MTESPFSTQGWNRYSYVGNSPLNFTDPSGYCFMGCFWKSAFRAIGNFFRQNWGSLVQIAAAAICSAVGGPGLGAACGAVASAIVTGITSGDLGKALRAGLISAVTAIAFYGVGELTGQLFGPGQGILDPIRGGHGPLGFMSEAHLFNVAGHALVGCGSAVASGGKCGPGALSAGAGSFVGPLMKGSGFTAKLVATSTIGGLASVAGGGKFGNGAMTAAFGYLFNEFGDAAQRGYEPTAYPSGWFENAMICNGVDGRGCVAVGAQNTLIIEQTALFISGVGSLVRGILGLGEAAGYTLTRTVAGHVAERPYVNSSLLIDEIVATGRGVPDAFIPGALRFDVAGSWAGSFGVRQGTYELVIHPQTRVVSHFLFRSAK